MVRVSAVSLWALRLLLTLGEALVLLHRCAFRLGAYFVCVCDPLKGWVSLFGRQPADF
jgi:hypothetical protein